MRSMTRILVKRVAISVAVFVCVHAFVSAVDQYRIQQWFIEVAKAAGCQPVFESRVMMWGPNGPFYGEDFKTRAFNYLVTRGPWWVELMAALVPAMVVYGLCMRWERSRWLGYRGETRCGGCGYGLKGLKGVRCPECGRGI